MRISFEIILEELGYPSIDRIHVSIRARNQSQLCSTNMII